MLHLVCVAAVSPSLGGGGGDNIIADIEKQLGVHRCNPGQGSGQSSSCFDCPAGYFQTQSGTEWYQICFQCPNGQFQPSSTQTSCEFCPAGRWGQEKAGKSVRACWLCRRGRYSSAGAVQCATSCPSGTHNSSDLPGLGRGVASGCLPCRSGQFRSEMSQDWRCQLCDPGQYSSDVGQTRCQLCPNGRLAPIKGIARCIQCPKGQWSTKPWGKSCLNCGKQHQLSAMARETNIATKKWLTWCKNGNENKHNNNNGIAAGAASSASSHAGARCPPGHGVASHSLRPLSHYRPLSIGFLSNSTCDACLPGLFSNAGAPFCATCALGQVNNRVGGNYISQITYMYTTSKLDSIVQMCGFVQKLLRFPVSVQCRTS